MDPQLQQFLQYLSDPNLTSSSVNTAPTTAAPSDVLQSFFSLPQYQLLYGTNANQSDPTQRFHADPGFQYAIDQALRQVQQASAAKGLLESGITQRDLLTTAQGLQDQTYQNWLGQQNALFTNYQQQLQGLTSLGSQQANINAGQDINAGNLLGSTIGGYNMATGQGSAQSQLGVSDNIASLLNNLGVLNANAYLNTGAAEANALMQSFGINAQLQNNAMASNAQSQSSYLQGLGAMLGAQQISGGNVPSGYGNTTYYPNGSSTYTGNPWGSFL